MSIVDCRLATKFPIEELDYVLPPDLIAQTPAARREDARLLIVDRATSGLRDGSIVDLRELLRPGDLLVLNNTKVLPAKFTARRKTGGAVPGLFVEEDRPGLWRVLLEGSKRLRIGEVLTVEAYKGPPVSLELLARDDGGHWDVRVEAEGSVEQVLERIGQTPLPPYIRRSAADRAADAIDRDRYQTVYAQRPGAVAAPTAGLHLTEPLLDRLRDRGVDIAFVTLHVGLGTFKPITANDLSRHVMHAERYELPQETAEAVKECRRCGGHVVAVGTTTVRVLESSLAANDTRIVRPGRGSTTLLIYPPYQFRVVDALLTNFHLPKSTLLALVMAFAGVERTRRAYAHAVEQRYRFYSFGDAMLVM